MRNIILATAFVVTLSGTAQANVIIDEYVDMKRDFEENMQHSRDQLERNKEQIRGLFLRVKGIVTTTTEKLNELNNGQYIYCASCYRITWRMRKRSTT